jgi:hypothetical protein
VAREPDLLVVNGVYPPTDAIAPTFSPPDVASLSAGAPDASPADHAGPPADEAPAAGDETPDVADALRLWRRRRAINDRELARLAGAWAGPRLVLPLVPEDRGPALIDALLRYLRPAVGVAAA